ncbi:phosphatidylglycerol lysyltransferase domain-containing protein [Actinoplanes sp. KI2]|uniref:phosphatidylglycerol lysyltransferase domain-containing protein n=1 Tax=Actinoplanes sp. KI2 TaxID=2983315 RepID=UPI0021D58D34|nr:phosphatidylglycerol lysyltransferase domain-containing protein [Actinoplanes sp. KI2]MCU7727425.1 phosphatidylglycerol lysyltransferase domain-containing protein [Actinoplanes sp. KI2]
MEPSRSSVLERTPGAARDDGDAGVRRWQQPPSSRRAVSRLVQFVGLVGTVFAVLPPRHHRFALLADMVPTAGMLTARAATAVIGVLLIYLGAGLRRGKRRAWQLALVLSLVSVGLHLVKGGLAPLVFCGVVAALLVVKRDQFTAETDPGNRWRAARACAMFLTAGFVLGFLEIAVRVNRLDGRPGMLRWAEHAGLGLIGVTGPIHFQHPLGGLTVTVTTGAFGLLAFASAGILLLRPCTGARTRDAGDRDRLRAMLDKHGDGDSLGYFALRDDKQVLWSPSGRAAVAYKIVNGVSLASGDPLGLPSEWPRAIGQWLADCARHGWTPGVLACGTAGGRAYQKAGLDVIELGDEAIVDVGGFTLEGRAMRGVRQAVARMRRSGYSCQVVRQRDLPEERFAETVACANALRDGKVERGFSMALSRLGDPEDGDCLLVLCHDEDGRLRGLLQFVPWGRRGLSLDLMRGDRTAPNGLTELMVVAAIEAAPDLGVERISLNFAVLRSVFARAEELGAGPVIRLWSRVLRMASRLWQIESLYRANAKYLPDWQPRFLCFPSARDLPRIAVAALSAEAFLPAHEPRRGPAAPRGPKDQAPAATPSPGGVETGK